ncbi:MAG: lipoprotein [Bacteroidota bacterium]
MKKFLLLLLIAVVLAGCNKNGIEDPNPHYGLKDYVLVVDLIAGQNTTVGTVTYLDTEDGFFKVTYDLVDEWTMSESHVYAGPIDNMPTNSPGAPKIGKFPYQTDHDPEVTTYTYTIPVTSWDKFVCAAHAVVNHPTLPSETAWAAGNETFTDNGWGGFTSNFSTSATYVEVIYGIQQTTDGSLVVVYINISNPAPEVIIVEPVNTSGGGTVVAAAFDPFTNNLFFVIGNTLYVYNMNTGDPCVAIGTVPGLPGGGAFVNGNFYYIDLDPTSSSFNEIVEVQLSYDETTGTWTMAINDNFSDPIPFTNFQITDMASNGLDLYLVGNDNNNNGNVGLIIFDLGTGIWNSTVTNTLLSGIAQITFGPDGNMYAVDTDNTGNTELVTIDLGSGDTDIIDLSDGSSLGDMSDLVTGKN